MTPLTLENDLPLTLPSEDAPMTSPKNLRKSIAIVGAQCGKKRAVQSSLKKIYGSFELSRNIR